VQSANLAATAALCVSTVAVGAATDRFGLRRVATPVLLLLIAATYGLYFSAARMQSALLPFYILAGIGLGAVALPPIIAVRAFYPVVRLMACSSKSHEPSSLYRRYGSVVASSYSYGTERAFLKLTMAYA
jgi:MFS family permease